MSGVELRASELILREFLAFQQSGVSVSVDRPEVVAHATLSALVHHWPSRASPGMVALLEATAMIKTIEHSRWAVQRRIAIAKLVRDAGKG